MGGSARGQVLVQRGFTRLAVGSVRLCVVVAWCTRAFKLILHGGGRKTRHRRTLSPCALRFACNRFARSRHATVSCHTLNLKSITLVIFLDIMPPSIARLDAAAKDIDLPVGDTPMKLPLRKKPPCAKKEQRSAKLPVKKIHGSCRRKLANTFARRSQRLNGRGSAERAAEVL